MYTCKKIIIVEGKYDKIKLSSFVDANIIECGGFQIFCNQERRVLIKQLAQKCGAILLLDSDVAGFKIRSYLRNYLKDCDVLDVFIPDIYGKEKRKEKPSKEGKLGVEGVPKDILVRCLKSAGAFEEMPKNEDPIEKIDLFNLGLIGHANSVQLRHKLILKLGLPENIPTKSLLGVLNQISSLKEVKKEVKNILTNVI